MPSATHAGAPAKVARLGVLGSSGYTGHEFVRLALGHPGLELVALATREPDLRPLAERFPGVDPGAADLPAPIDLAGFVTLLEDDVLDTVVSCLPHGAWRDLTSRWPALAARPARIVDLSADHRDGSAGYVYGLPEAFRETIRAATRVANPGCYPTAATLALLPAAAAGWLAGPVVITALSGVSGAGRSAAARTSFVEIEGGASLYRVGEDHPHVAEMERALARITGAPAAVAFAPQLAPMARGILLTATAPLVEPKAPAEVRDRYETQYAGEAFVRLLEPGMWPETRAVRGSNRVDIQVTTVHGGRTLLATAALDNLGKGAAGQAVQNLNLVLGWPETTGLSRHGSPW